MLRLMHRTALAALVSATLGSVVAFAQTAPEAKDSLIGVWRDPGDSVHVRTAPCGDRICGSVIWANDKAKADARRGGTQELLGTMVFRDFKRVKANVWRGRVFVPDLNVTFSGTLTLLNNGQLRGKGCLVAGVGCKTRTWTRVS